MTYEEAMSSLKPADADAAPADTTAPAAKQGMSYEEAMAAIGGTPPETSGYMKEAAKGAARGAVSGAAGAVRGGADVADIVARRGLGMEGAPDLGATAAANAAEAATNKAMAPAPGWEGSTTGKIGETVGGLAPLAGAAILGGPIGVAGAVGAGAAQGADALQQRAAQAGASQGAQDVAVLGGGAVGTLMGMIPGAGALLAKLGPAAAKGVIGYALRTASSGAAGAGIGGVSAALNDAIEKYTVNPDKIIGEGALDDAAMTGIAAALLHGTIGEAHHAMTRPAPAPEAPPEAPPAPPQLALPPPGTAPMSDTEIAIARAKARAGDRAFSPEGDTLNVTPPAMDANGNPVETGKPGTGGTAFRPDQLTPDELALVSKHFGDKTPAEIAGMVPDAQQRLLRIAQEQEAAQQKIDALGGMRVSDTSGEGPTSPASRPNGHPDRPRGQQPLDSEIERGDDVGDYARSGTGISDRPFRGDSTDNASPDQQADFEQKARDEAEAQRKATLDDLMRAWAERENRDRDRAKAQEEANKSKQNAGGRRPFADAEDRYADTPASRTAKGQDGDGNYHVDGDGFVMSTKGGPIRFMSAKEAARWIIDKGHAQSASQVFEIANHPGQRGGFTVRETMRTKPEEKAAPGAEQPAGASSTEQPGAAQGDNGRQGAPIPLTGPKDEPVKGTPEVDAREQGLRNQVRVYSSGMSRSGDLKSGAHVWGGYDSRGIGVDVGELSNPAIEHIVHSVVEKKTNLFIDSGAFSLFKKGLRSGDTEPLDFDAILGKYDHVLQRIDDYNHAEPLTEEEEDALTPQQRAEHYYSRAGSEEKIPTPLIVVPDIVGDQAGSLDLVKRYADYVRAHTEFNVAKPIVPLQKGALSLTDAYRQVVKTIGNDNFITGIPASPKAMVSPAELLQFLRDTKPKNIHFLGAASDRTLAPLLRIVAEAGITPDHVSADANILRSTLYGRQPEGMSRHDAISAALNARGGAEGEALRRGPETPEQAEARAQAEKIPPVEGWKPPDPDAPPVPQNRRLLIMACCDAKAATAGAAIDLYQGGSYQTLRKAAGEAGMPKVVILSAKHGFIAADTPIAPYDERMSSARAGQLVNDAQAMARGRALVHGDYDEVLVHAGADYRPVVDVIRDALPPGARLERTVGGIGEQKSQLGKWVRRGEPAEVAERGKPAAAPEPAKAETPPAAPAGERAPGDPGNITYLDPAEIGTDAKTFQFRTAQDERGTSGRLKGVTKWEPTLADPLIVYKDENGKHWVADGHHRLALAQDLNERGNGPGKVPAFVLDAKDGYTPGKARFLAAFKNLAGGHGDATDAAKVIREANRAGAGIELPQLPDTALVRQGRSLASLSDEAFGLVANGKVEPDHAALVPEYFKDPAEQVAAIHALMEIGPHNVTQARSVLADVKEAGIAHGTTEDMFGSHSTAAALIGERARVLDSALRALRGTAKVFGAAAGGHDILSDAGNKLDRDANVKGKNESDVLIAHIAADGNRKGPISDALRAAAQALKDGKSVKGAAADFLVQARKIIRRGDQGDVPPGANRGGGGDQAKSAPEVNELERPSGTDAIRTNNGTVFTHLLGGQFTRWLAAKAGQFASHFDAAKAWVIERGRDTTHEHMLVYDGATGKFVSAITSNAPHYVAQSKALRANMLDPSQRLVITHNHPGGSALSPGDLTMLAGAGVRIMSAVTHDGKITAARLHPDTVAALRDTMGLKNLASRMMKALEAIHDAHDDNGLPNRWYELTDLLNRALARAQIIDYVSTRDIVGGHDAQNLDAYRQFLELALEERARLGLPELAEKIDVGNDRFSGSASERDGAAFVSQIGEEATGLTGADHGDTKRGMGTQAPSGEKGSRNDLTQSEPDYSGPWISNKDNQGRLFEAKKPETFDQTDQGEQRVIPGAEKLTPEQVAARAKAERDAKLLAVRQQQSKMRSSKPQQEAGGLFGGDKPKQGGLFDEVMPEARRETKEREESYPQHAQDSLKQWAGARDDRSVAQRIHDGITQTAPGFFDRFYQAVVDRRWTPSERLATKLGLRSAADLNAHGEVRAAVSAHDAAAFADRSATAVEQNWTHGPLKMVGGLFKTVDWRDRNGRLVDGMKGILRPVGKAGLVREFATYDRIIRARRLAGEGRDQQYNAARDEPTVRFLEQKYPFFRDVHDEMQRFNKANLQALVESGVKTQAQIDELTRHGDYSPFYRKLVEDSGIKGPGNLNDTLTNQSAYRRLKGGDNEIGEYLGNVTRNAQSIAAVAMKNLAADRYVRDEEMLGMAHRMRGNPVDMEHMDNVVRIYRNGEAQYWKIDNKMTFNALKGLDGHPLNPFTKFLGVPARVLRTMTTHSPVFLAYNHPFRESIVGAFTGRKGGVKPVISAYQGMWEVLKNSPLTQDLRHHMIGGGFDLAGGEGNAAKTVMGSYAAEANNASGLMRRAWHQYEKLIEAADLGVRTQIFKKEMAAHGDEWEASKAALSNGVNFKQRGSSEVLRMASIAIPFLNARIQGLDTLGRAAVRQPALSAKRALMLAGLTAAYYAYVQNNPLYQRAPDQLKDDNWLLPVGNTLVRAPAPFELGVVVKRSVERFLRYMTGQDTGADSRAALTRAMLDTFKFNPIPQAFAPATQAFFNYDTFTGSPVEKRSVENLPKAQRFDDKTSEIAKGIGSVTGPHLSLSPMQIDHLIHGYFGTIGDYALQASNAIIRTAEGGPARPSSGAAETPGLSSIVKTNRNIGSAQLGQFYEMKHQVDELVAGVHRMQQQGDAAGARNLIKNNAGLYAQQGYTKGIGAALTQIHKAETSVRNGNLSADDKRAALDRYDAQRQRLLRDINTHRQRAAG